MGDYGSNYAVCGLIRDFDDMGNKWDDAIAEEHFCQPIAKVLAQQLQDETCKLCPEMHTKTHDYLLTMNQNFCAVTGKAKSGHSQPKEVDCCLVGMCKNLNVYQYACGMTSSANKCYVHMGEVGPVMYTNQRKAPSLKLSSVCVEKGTTEADYVQYVGKILTALEIFVGKIAEMDGDLDLPTHKSLKLTTNAMGFSPADGPNIPGVYVGSNAALIYEHYNEYFPLYIEGHQNKQNCKCCPLATLYNRTNNMYNLTI